jgi:hypothetical protein
MALAGQNMELLELEPEVFKSAPLYETSIQQSHRLECSQPRSFEL